MHPTPTKNDITVTRTQQGITGTIYIPGYGYYSKSYSAEDYSSVQKQYEERVTSLLQRHPRFIALQEVARTIQPFVQEEEISGVGDFFKKVWSGIKKAATTIWSGIKQAVDWLSNSKIVSAVWSAAKGVAAYYNPAVAAAMTAGEKVIKSFSGYNTNRFTRGHWGHRIV